ncbi:hypothetical protein LZ554_005103 [Drepanopeziza brunnea f. sp. 'monogermtubi']|nr:hypothetical protein LZ554_005103 [Drepanopeziza brunnea f. sp. 'monogermtubi']
MSLPTSGFVSSRRLRAPSVGSHSSPRLIPGSLDAGDGGSDGGMNYGSFRGRPEMYTSGINSSMTSDYREPTRSSVHLSYRGMPQAHVDNTFTAQSVREDTAELASYALSDRASVRSVSPPRQRTAQASLESYFARGAEGENSPLSNPEGLHRHIIEEVSEPATPEESSPSSSDRGPGTSVLTNMLKISPSENQHDDEGNYGESEVGTDGNSGVQSDPTERTSLLGNKDTRFEPQHPDWIRGEQDIEGQESLRRPAWPKLRNAVFWPQEKGLEIARIVLNPKAWNGKAIWAHAVTEPAKTLPAVVLGLLLNILDALAYGMILFPLGSQIFEKLGAAGISMFYLSCIISQLVYSCGGSCFRGVVGSQMIEVVPFFHKMAFSILETVGEENPHAVIATTITTYAISSIVTGIVFFLMGFFGCGYIVGFIPRHILVGCIGGVGFFLVATGFEITSRLNGNLNYDLTTLKKLTEPDTFVLWIIPLILALILYKSQPIFNTKSFPRLSKFYVPLYILGVAAVFYFFVISIDQLDPEHLRKAGWIFERPEAGEPWWYFYTLYDFKIVHWGAVAECFPSMLALTFFGVLHVPINVPALAFQIKEDNLNLDRELIGHGVSNVLSGFVGSVQNYLVYTNTVLFIRSGGDSRLAGIILAICTAGVMVIGPVVIGFIPTMMVGTLIFLLGFELLSEALWSTRKKLHYFEYFTVLAIVVIMGVYDFVAGICFGVALAFVSEVVQTSRIPAVRATYSGEIAGSTVRRNPTQYRYLREVGSQINVTKLAGYLFFGTIVSVEERIRGLVEDKAFDARPIRFLICDLVHVTGIDYSAAEAFNRIFRILNAKGVALLLSGVDWDEPLGQTLRAVGLGEDGVDVKIFDELNSALESCENELLKTFYASRAARVRSNDTASSFLDVPGRPRSSSHIIDAQCSSPRGNHLRRVATTTLDDNPGESRYLNFKEPLRLILRTFHGLTEMNEDFWFQILPFFVRKEYRAGEVLYHRGEEATGFYLLEDGILRADYELPQGRYFESIVAGTTCGELPFFSETDRTATVQAERDCVTWLLDRENWVKLQKSEPAVAQELLRISLKLTSERMSAITSYVLTTADDFGLLRRRRDVPAANIEGVYLPLLGVSIGRQLESRRARFQRHQFEILVEMTDVHVDLGAPADDGSQRAPADPLEVNSRSLVQTPISDVLGVNSRNLHLSTEQAMAMSKSILDIFELDEEPRNEDQSMGEDGEGEDEETNMGDQQRRTERLRGALPILTQLWCSDSNQIELVTEKLADGSRDPKWRIPLGDSGILNFFLEKLSGHTLRHTLKIHVLRLIGNSCADTDGNRARVVASNYMRHIVLELQDESLTAFAIPVLFNICIDYEPAQKQASECFLTQELIALMSSPKFNDSRVLLSYSCKILDMMVAQASEQEVAPDSTPIVLLGIAADRESPVGMDDFIAVVNTAVTYLQHEKFQKALVAQGALDRTLAVLVDSCTRFDAQPSIPTTGVTSPSDQDDAKALTEMRNGFIQLLSDISALPEFKEAYPITSPFSSSLLRWLSSPQPQLKVCACIMLGNLARSDATCEEFVHVSQVHTILISILVDATDSQLLHATIGFLKNLALPARNKETIGDAGLIDVLPRLWALDILQPIQLSAISLARQLTIGNLNNVRRVCKRLSEDTDSPAYTRTKLSLLIALFERTDVVPIKMEISRLVTSICRVLNTSVEREITEAETAQIQHNFFALHPDVGRPLTFMVSQTKWPVVRSEGWFVFALIARTPEGAQCVSDMMKDVGVFSLLAETLTGKPFVDPEPSSPGVPAVPAGAGASPSPPAIMPSANEEFEAHNPESVQPHAQASEIKHLDRENALLLVSEVLKHKGVEMSASRRTTSEELLRRGTELLQAHREANPNANR